jgi:hypothetical protein
MTHMATTVTAALVALFSNAQSRVRADAVKSVAEGLTQPQRVDA